MYVNLHTHDSTSALCKLAPSSTTRPDRETQIQTRQVLESNPTQDSAAALPLSRLTCFRRHEIEIGSFERRPPCWKQQSKHEAPPKTMMTERLCCSCSLVLNQIKIKSALFATKSEQKLNNDSTMTGRSVVCRVWVHHRQIFCAPIMIHLLLQPDEVGVFFIALSVAMF